MKFRGPILTMAALSAFCISLPAQTPRISLTTNAVIAFDAPGAGKGAGQGTTPKGINDEGEITGF